MLRRRPAATLTGRTEDDDLGAQAIRALNKAHYTENRPAFDRFDDMDKSREAQEAREKGLHLLQPSGADNGYIEKAAGEAMLTHPGQPIKGLTREQLSLEICMIDTLETPTMIGLCASQQRMEAAAKIGVLQPAMDAAETAQAGNSLEKMLCHQLAACHYATMNLYARATGAQEFGKPNATETVRFMNAAARQMDAYREGALALMKLKTGGKQTVVVQHVHVAEGGQAVITGNLTKQGASGEVGGDQK